MIEEHELKFLHPLSLPIMRKCLAPPLIFKWERDTAKPKSSAEKKKKLNMSKL